MLTSLRGRLWLVGSVVSLSLLSACAHEDEEGHAESSLPSHAHAAGQELSSELKDLEVSLSADKASFSATESARVRVTLRNTASRSNGNAQAAKLLKRFTPAEGVEEPLFSVRHEGAEVAYAGPHIKRPPPSEEDYLTLAPGESQSWMVDLAESYDLSKTGTYRVRFVLGALRSNELKLTIEGRASGPRAPTPDVTVSSSVAFSKCDSAQQATVLEALGVARGYADNAVSYLSGTPSATPRYTTWFGAFSTNGWNTALSHFVAIKDVYDTKTTTFDCGCKKKYYAYVYPNQPYNIYLCNVFWSAPMSGTDSKGGTIIHETSHFNVVAGTDDWAYGQTNAKSLAISDPDKALNNADNHEYFAENTPFLQ